MACPRHLYKETASSFQVKVQTRYENVWHLLALYGICIGWFSLKQAAYCVVNLDGR